MKVIAKFKRQRDIFTSSEQNGIKTKTMNGAEIVIFRGVDI